MNSITIRTLNNRVDSICYCSNASYSKEKLPTAFSFTLVVILKLICSLIKMFALILSSCLLNKLTLVKSSYQINVGEMLLCMAYLRRSSQVAALAYSNFFFCHAGIVELFLKFQSKSTRHSFDLSKELLSLPISLFHSVGSTNSTFISLLSLLSPYDVHNNKTQPGIITIS